MSNNNNQKPAKQPKPIFEPSLVCRGHIVGYYPEFKLFQAMIDMHRGTGGLEPYFFRTGRESVEVYLENMKKGKQTQIKVHIGCCGNRVKHVVRVFG